MSNLNLGNLNTSIQSINEVLIHNSQHINLENNENNNQNNSSQSLLASQNSPATSQWQLCDQSGVFNLIVQILLNTQLIQSEVFEEFSILFMQLLISNQSYFMLILFTQQFKFQAISKGCAKWVLLLAGCVLFIPMVVLNILRPVQLVLGCFVIYEFYFTPLQQEFDTTWIVLFWIDFGIDVFVSVITIVVYYQFGYNQLVQRKQNKLFLTNISGQLKSLKIVSKPEDSCPICLEDLEVAKVLECCHNFHEKCITHWFETNPYKPCCPICKRDYQDDIINFQVLQ